MQLEERGGLGKGAGFGGAALFLDGFEFVQSFFELASESRAVLAKRGQGAGFLAQRFDDDERGVASGCSVTMLSSCSENPRARRLFSSAGMRFRRQERVGERLN